MEREAYLQILLMAGISLWLGRYALRVSRWKAEGLWLKSDFKS